MARLQSNARLAEATIQKVARDGVRRRGGRGPDQRPRQRVQIRHLHPLLRARLADVEDRRRIEILSPTEAIVRNGPRPTG